MNTFRRSGMLLAIAGLSMAWAAGAGRAEETKELYLVPNFHPGCMGWLVKYSEERNYCLYSYLAHLDRVAADPLYKFAFSEIPHLITMMEYEPGRLAEFRERLKQGRVECVNAFVLEPTVNLSGGEALVQQGVQGLRWYQEVMGLRPRYCWMIDTVGWHEQMGQIVAGLGLDGFVYCRYNPTAGAATDDTAGQEPAGGWALHWIESPDGTRALALNSGGYCDKDFCKAFRCDGPLTAEELDELIGKAQAKGARFPGNGPILALGGQEDYSQPFRYQKYPAELVAAWNRASPKLKLRIATPSEYLDAVLPAIRAGQYEVPTVRSGSGIYGWTAFWMDMPVVKQWYRRAEHGLQAAEALATTASLSGGMTYPAQELANSWLLMALNMDRNVLWGVAVDGSFADDQSWDTRDRFEYVEQATRESNLAAMDCLTQRSGDGVVLFNPVNWKRKDPVELKLPAGYAIGGADCQVLPDGGVLAAGMDLPSMGLAAERLAWAGLVPPAITELPESIETAYYTARIDAKTGALVSLKLKDGGREMLGGPANVVLAEEPAGPHNVPEKAKRKLVASSSQYRPTITVARGKVATVVEVRGPFHGGGELRREMRFYERSPRIDFVTETNALPAGTILSVEFPLADAVTEMRRGIPYGFSRGDCVTSRPADSGVTKGIIPVIRWSDYGLEGGGGVAILDRGVPGRELVGSKAIILLHSVCAEYYKRPVIWMADNGRQTYGYALVAHAEGWDQANIARMAWEYNSPVSAAAGRSVSEPRSFVDSSENVIVEAVRRDGDQIELRLVECIGKAGSAWVRVNLPHGEAALTDLLGGHRVVLGAGPVYEFAVRPQQIVTMRLRADRSVAKIEALRSFSPVIPAAKRQYMLEARNPAMVGHPPREP